MDEICKGCDGCVEDELHALIYCARVQAVWEKMELENGVFRERRLDSFADWWCSVAMIYKGEDLCRIAMVCWGMWRARNEALFRSSMNVRLLLGLSLITKPSRMQMSNMKMMRGSFPLRGHLPRRVWLR